MKRIRSESIPLGNIQSWDIAESLLPEYKEEQYKDLEEFINNGGEFVPIVVSENGLKVIDGYNRWRTAKRIGKEKIECDVYSYESEEEMEMHAIVLNSKRRHLNRIQVARAAARLANIISPEELPEAQPKVETATEKEDFKPDHLEEQPPLNNNSEIEQPETIQRDNSGTPDDKELLPVFNPEEQLVKNVSKKLGVPQSTVKQVTKVDSSGDRSLIAAMEEKVITVKQAAKIAELENEEQRREAIIECEREKIRRNSFTSILTRTCDDCAKKLHRNFKKFKNAEFTEEEAKNMRASIAKVISEAKNLLREIDVDQPVETEKIEHSEDNSPTNSTE